MDLLTLEQYFNRKISIRTFLDSEHEDLIAYIKATKEKKKSPPVRIENEVFFDGYDSNDIRLLLNDYLKNELLEWDLEYIMEALDSLDEESSDERARYVVFCISTPEINVSISKEEALVLLNYLNTQSEMAKSRSKPNLERSNYRSILEI